MGGDGNGNNSFATTIIVVSLSSLTSTKNRKRTIDKEGQTEIEKKIAIGGFQETGKKGSNSISV
jgi:hypothetical protein